MTKPLPMLVFAVGSEVLLDDGVVTARVTGVLIREGRTTYEVVWWNDRKREEEVVEEWEIQSSEQKQRIDPIL